MMTQNEIKVPVGRKGRLAVIPTGWIQVTEGLCRKGDKYANTITAKFYEVDPEDVGLPVDGNFDCLIRECLTPKGILK